MSAVVLRRGSPFPSEREEIRIHGFEKLENKKYTRRSKIMVPCAKQLAYRIWWSQVNVSMLVPGKLDQAFPFGKANELSTPIRDILCPRHILCSL